MLCTARPSASTAWKYSGLLAGARKYADPSDSTGTVFEEYEAPFELLPSVFLIDQAGIIQIRADGVNEPEPFEEEMTEILAMIDELIANPPEE